MESRRKSNQVLSEKHLAQKSKLKTCVKILCQETPGYTSDLQKLTVDFLKEELHFSTYSLIDLLHLLKILHSHYETLKQCYDYKITDIGRKRILADVLSVLAMVNDLSKAEAGTERETLKYRLLGSQDDFTSWGLGYVNHLVMQIMDEYNQFFQRCGVGSGSAEEDNVIIYKEVLLNMVEQIVAFYLRSGLEVEAVDLVMEFEQPWLYMSLLKFADQRNYRKICSYVTSLAKHRFLECGGISMLLLGTVYRIYMNFKEYASALRIAFIMEQQNGVTNVFRTCDDVLQKKQLCNMVARHGVHFKLDGSMMVDEEDRKELQDIVNKVKWSEGYLALAGYLDVMEPKTPEDVYKGRSRGVKKYLANTFVNAFVNAGFGKDKLMVGQQKLVFKNEANGKMSETASLGLIMLWNVEAGLAELQRYMQYDDTYVKAGALLGVGILNSSVKPDCDPALNPLLDYVDKNDEHQSIRIGAIMGLGLTFAYSKNGQVAERLIAVIKDHESNIELLAFAVISLGLVYLGFSNKRAVDAIVTAIKNQNHSNPECAVTKKFLSFRRLVYFGLSLLFWEQEEEMLQVKTDALGTIDEKTRDYFVSSLLSCAYVGSGDVLKVQHLLEYCDEEAAVLGIAMVAMAEEVGLEMAIRSLDHMLLYGEQNVRKTVPLALALLCISNPKKSNVVNTLSRLTHDSNLEVAMCAIISLGLVGSGTNNGRIAWKLQKLSRFYADDADILFCVQIAQGLLHLGKGLLTLNPYYSDRLLLSPVAIGGLVTFLHCCLDMRALMLENYHFVLYFLVLAMQPKMLLTLDENLKMIHVPVCVGEAVDVVGKPGQPSTISGFQTFKTPVLLGFGERAELSTDKYVPLSPILEGFVILKHNPDYREAEKE